ncbi:MAG: DNA mismatch endonuclease Vsr [Proteobacteria bacterium]|nr:DNA mismatch endonuclease Vsr [Pseudomonadota bacterium]
MADTRSRAQRSAIMKSVGSKNTGPELAVRRILHACGYRFRLHRKDLPGTPDIVLSGRRKIIFVHGCFWHGHRCRKGGLPKSRIDFWTAKISKNRKRDAKNRRALKLLGWDTAVVWQCQLKSEAKLERRLVRFVELRRIAPP